jgi:prevent-host-death family protein
MASVVSIRHAKAQLSRIVDDVAAGREVIIAKAGRKLARLVPFEPKPRRKKLGGLKGRIRVPDDFNRPLDAAGIVAFESR